MEETNQKKYGIKNGIKEGKKKKTKVQIKERKTKTRKHKSS